MRIVWLASYPRSGVTFMRHVIERVYGLPTWTVYREESRATLPCDRNRRWPNDADGTLPVYFVKTHSLFAAGRDEPTIHLVRDGLDVVVSFAHYARDIAGDQRPLPKIQDDIIGGRGFLGSWGIHTLAWSARDIPRITYDQLVADPVATVVDVVDSLGLGIKADMGAKLATFEELHAKRPDFYRVGRSGSGREELSQKQQGAFLVNHSAAQKVFEELNVGLVRPRRTNAPEPDLLPVMA